MCCALPISFVPSAFYPPFFTLVMAASLVIILQHLYFVYSLSTVDGSL